MNLADLHDRAEAFLEDQAKQELADDLKAGKKVNGCDLYDCLDSAINGTPDVYKALLEKWTQVMLDDGEREFLVDEFRDALIARYLESGLGQDAVAERVATIEEDRE